MALTLDYSMQEDGVVMIGTDALDNVTSASVSWEQDRTEQTRTAFGGIKKIRSVGKVKCTLTINLFDESGITGALNSYLVGDTTGIDKVIKIRPLGTGAGLKELILDPGTDDFGMDLATSSADAESGEDLPAVSGSMTWVGWFDEQIPFTAQSA